MIYKHKSGITEQAKKFVVNHILKMGTFTQVKCVNNKHDWTTYIFTDTEDCMIISGFSMGYVGEGSRGLEWLLKTFGFKYCQQDIYDERNIQLRWYK